MFCFGSGVSSRYHLIFIKKDDCSSWSHLWLQCHTKNVLPSPPYFALCISSGLSFWIWRPNAYFWGVFWGWCCDCSFL